jgi:hypothetical protein
MQETLPAIDWGQPWLAPWRRLAELLGWPWAPAEVDAGASAPG